MANVRITSVKPFRQNQHMVEAETRFTTGMLWWKRNHVQEMVLTTQDGVQYFRYAPGEAGHGRRVLSDLEDDLYRAMETFQQAHAQEA